MSKMIFIATLIFLLSTFSFAGDYNCVGANSMCQQQCVEVFECVPPCQAMFNVNCKTFDTGGSSVGKIQGCEITDIRSLGYTRGNKHEFCLNNGWNGGVIPGNNRDICWKTPNNNGKSDCSRLNAFYQCRGENPDFQSGSCCDHLTPEDAKKLGQCF